MGWNGIGVCAEGRSGGNASGSMTCDCRGAVGVRMDESVRRRDTIYAVLLGIHRFESGVVMHWRCTYPSNSLSVYHESLTWWVVQGDKVSNFWCFGKPKVVAGDDSLSQTEHPLLRCPPSPPLFPKIQFNRKDKPWKSKQLEFKWKYTVLPGKTNDGQHQKKT